MKTILITGGSGFLGRYLANTLKGEYQIILGSRNNKNNKLAEKITGCKTIPLDVVHIESVRDVIREVKPHIILHAAATKEVPLGEVYPMEVIDVNIIGSQNIARVAMENNVEFVLGISTDKSCPPIRNMYGLSKATMERSFCLSDRKSNTKFAVVRYGNVVWSTNSVLPIWYSLTKEGKSIKNTGVGMRRFFFTVEDAVQLVKTAIENQDLIRGQILSREMKSAAMEDLSQVWCEMYNTTCEYLPVREGERVDEYLVGESELEFCQGLEINNIKHFLISPNTKAPIPYPEVFTSANAIRMTKEEIQKIIEAPKDI